MAELILKTNCNNMDELTLYKEAVHKYASDKIDDLFHNEGNGHALIICSAMFVLT